MTPEHQEALDACIAAEKAFGNALSALQEIGAPDPSKPGNFSAASEALFATFESIAALDGAYDQARRLIESETAA